MRLPWDDRSTSHDSESRQAMKWIAMFLLLGTAVAQQPKPIPGEQIKPGAVTTPALPAKPPIVKAEPIVIRPWMNGTGTNCDDCTTIFTPISPPIATWTQGVKDGVYTATFTDPNNHWRCVVSATEGEGTRKGIIAFTTVCYDTTETGNVPPPAPPEGIK